VLAMDHFRLRDASQRTTREFDEDEWPGSEVVDLPFPAALLAGGKSFATQRSP